MTTQRLGTGRFGPFTRGVIESANRHLDLQQTLRFARNAVFTGVGRLQTRGGDEVALTLLDDGNALIYDAYDGYEGDPSPYGIQPVTSVVLVKSFGDGAIAVAHSAITQRVYLYHLTAELDDWYDDVGALQGSAFPEPVGVLWSGVAEPPAVSMAEGLGIAYIAHNDALDAGEIRYPTKTFEAPGIISTLMENLDGTTPKPVAFLGVAAYNQHLIGFGFDKTNVAATAYRPEKIRHSAPSFGPLSGPGSGSFDVGHAVRSARERTTCVVVAGEVCYFGLNFGLWGMMGYGRDSFQKKSLSSTIGIAGISAACEAPDGWLYGWGHSGPFRVIGMGEPEELAPPIADTVAAIANPQRVIAAWDTERDQVVFYHDLGGERKRFASFDHTRRCWLGPDSALGVAVACAARIDPVYGSAVAGNPPDGPPATPSTTNIGTTTARANWVNGDTKTGTKTRLEVRAQGATTWKLVATLGTGATTAVITGLAPATAYEWRAAHVRNGQFSTWLGPGVGTQFTTNTSGDDDDDDDYYEDGDPMAPPFALSVADHTFAGGGEGAVFVQWANSGEAGAYTEVWRTARIEPPFDTPAPEDFSLRHTLAPGVSAWMWDYTGFPITSGKWWYKVRHVRNADVSPFTAAVEIGPTA